jgi:hypothetical protein
MTYAPIHTSGRSPLRAAVLLPVLCCCLLLAAIPAQARLVQVAWEKSELAAEAAGLPAPGTQIDGQAAPAPKPLSPAEERQAARQRGFVMAVRQEARAMLPAEITGPRLDVLDGYLRPMAAGFVRSYSEVSLQRTPAGGTMLLDVTLDTQALKDRLRRLGLLHAGTAPLDYSLTLGEAPEGAWEEIGRLQVLSGLNPAQGAVPSLELAWEPQGRMWTARLTTADDVYAAVNADLDTLWGEIWGRWFTRIDMGVDTAGEVVLEVEGWYTPDGVEAFDRLLTGWRSEVESAVLLDMVMRPTGITARWRLKVLDRAGLENRLGDYMPRRNLSYGFRDAYS